MAQHHFHLKADWQGGRKGQGTIESGNLKQPISIPEEMDGPGVGTNPDEMLIGAAAACYLITLAAMIERGNAPVEELSLETEGIVQADKSLKFEAIIHRPKLVVRQDASEQELEKIRRFVELAEKHCMISNALRGNVRLEVEAQFITN